MSANLFARLSGKFWFVCPYCEVVSIKVANWRQPKIRCRECLRTYSVGVALMTEAEAKELQCPALFTDQRPKHFANVCSPQWPDWMPLLGAVQGPIHLTCGCGQRIQERPVKGRTIQCPHCHSTLHVALLLWRAGKRRLPLDWSCRSQDDLTRSSRLPRPVRPHRGRPRGARSTPAT